MSSPDPRVLTIVGGHDFDPAALTGFVGGFGGGAILELEAWLDADAPVPDVLVLYTMHAEDPGRGGVERVAAALEGLQRSGAGILILHHSIFAFPEWEVWSKLVGIADRAVGAVESGHRLRIRVAGTGHPITTGLRDWEMSDETYLMAEPDRHHRVLLTTDHPRSMQAIAWVQEGNRSRVLTLQSGHDAASLGNAALREFARRGVRWLTRRSSS